MSPDSSGFHRFPLSVLCRLFGVAFDSGWCVVPEPAIGFDPVYDLGGDVLGDSRLGHKKLEPDLAVWEGTPVLRKDPRGDSFAPERLRLVVELLSPGTWRSDLGQGGPDAVDRWRTYLAAGVSEYWIVNATPKACGLPPRTALFLSAGEEAWVPLRGEGLQLSDVAVREFQPVCSGRVHSKVLDAPFDLSAFWAKVDELET